MKRTVNKITSILIVLLFVVISYSSPVSAAKIDYTEGTFKYVLDDVTKTAEIFDNPDNKSTGDIVLPEKLTYLDNQYVVTMIGKQAFYDNKDITSVIMPDTIKSTGTSAFAQTRKLEQVTCLKV